MVGCGVHFSSGEHPISIRCRIDDPCSGQFDPDVVLSISWDRLVSNPDSTISSAGTASCAAAVDLDEVPAQPASCGQQIVDMFNDAPSCIDAGLVATLNDAPATTFIDSYYFPQGAMDLSIPSPATVGTLTH